MAEKITGIPEECLPVIEPTGIVTAKSPYSYVHSGSRLLHPAVRLHLIDRFGNIYLTKRLPVEASGVCLWDTAVSGHVTYRETMVESLYRAAQEEYNLTDFNPYFLQTRIFESDLEKELDVLLAAIGNFELEPNPFKIDSGRWWPMEEVAAKTGDGIFTPKFEQEFKQIRNTLEALL